MTRMIDSFEMQKRYFTSQLKKFERRPAIHRERIADCELYLKMLEEAGSPGEFKRMVQRSGNMISTARADARDRYRNRAAVYEALGQERKALEDRQRLEVIESAETHVQLSRDLEEFEEDTTLGFDENRAMNALGAVIKAIFHLCTDPPGSDDRERSLAEFREYWSQMKEADPEVSWEKIMSYTAYRDRIIFTDGQLEFLEKKFREVVRDG